MVLIRDLLVKVLLLLGPIHVFTQSADPLDDFTVNHVLWDFVPPKKFYSTCMRIGEKVGDKSDKPEVCTAYCNEVVAPFKDPDADLHCRFMAQQMEIATLQETYHGPEGFCKSMLMYQSYMMKTDVLKYVSESSLQDVCTTAVANAMEQKPEGMDEYDALRQNLPLGCKSALEDMFRENGMPLPIANIACKGLTDKAEIALEARELSPNDQGAQFCEGNSLQSKAFDKSEASMAPPDFPMLLADWKPKIGWNKFENLIHKAFETPTEAFEKYDGDGDGKLDSTEWRKMTDDLGIPKMDAMLLRGIADGNKNHKVSKEEWQNAMGVTLPELVKYSTDKHKNAEEGWKAADANQDGKMDPKEFEAACRNLGISAGNAEKLLPEIDKDGDGVISQEEYKNVFGVDVPELKRRAREKYGDPEKAFEGMDSNGDGILQSEEFVKACEEMDIPAAQADVLLKEIDANMDGSVDPEEWDSQMGMTDEEVKKAIASKIGPNPKAMDTDGDGQISPEELNAGLEKAGASPKEAKKLAEAMDKDGDGKLSPEEIHEGTGGADMDEARGFEHPESQATVTLAEFKKRAKDTHGTPQAVVDAMDTDPKDGKISPEEFQAGCSQLKPPISGEDCQKLFPLVDVSPTDGSITPQELFAAIGGPDKFGLDVPEFKTRATKKNGAPEAAYKAMDANGDGKVSPEEFEAYGKSLDPPVTPEESKSLFKELDKSKSGFIEPEEFLGDVGKDSDGEAVEKGQLGDADGDGKISTEEKLAKTKALDTDGDGQVSSKEMGEAVASGKLSPEEMKALDTDGDGKLSADEIKQGAEATSATAADQKKAIDTDGDGKISTEEMAQAATSGKLSRKEVAKMDLDGDGKLSQEELTKGAADAETAAAASAPKEKMKKAMKGKFKSPKEAMQKMDADGDGKVSKEEIVKSLKDQGVSTRDADKMMKDLDKDGDGKVSAEEMYAATGPPDKFSKSPGDPGYEAPKEAECSPVSLDEFKLRLSKAFKNGKDAWNKITDGSTTMTPERFNEQAKDLGICPGEAKKLFKEIDLNGDNKIDESEWQEVIGVSEEEVQDAFVDAFPSSSDALKAADTDGDGEVSEAELEEVMAKKLGLSPAAAKKAAKEMMEKLDPDGTGKVSGDVFKDATKAKADDLTARIVKKLDTASDAFTKWDADGDGKLTEAEFIAGANSLGIAQDAAKDMWKTHDKDGDGVMSAEEFSRAFGISSDTVMEMCFQRYGNPSLAFEEMDTNHDGLLSPQEWAVGGAKMGLKESQINRLFKDMDTNNGENTAGHLSKWEFFDYLDYSEPNFKSWGDGFGDLDGWGNDHKKFNMLPHKPAAVRPASIPRALANYKKSTHHTVIKENMPGTTVTQQNTANSQKFMSKREVWKLHNEVLKMNNLKVANEWQKKWQRSAKRKSGKKHSRHHHHRHL